MQNESPLTTVDMHPSAVLVTEFADLSHICGEVTLQGQLVKKNYVCTRELQC